VGGISDASHLRVGNNDSHNDLKYAPYNEKQTRRKREPAQLVRKSSPVTETESAPGKGHGIKSDKS
jgi:hypothetical protein